MGISHASTLDACTASSQFPSAKPFRYKSNVATICSLRERIRPLYSEKSENQQKADEERLRGIVCIVAVSPGLSGGISVELACLLVGYLDESFSLLELF